MTKLILTLTAMLLVTPAFAQQANQGPVFYLDGDTMRVTLPNGTEKVVESERRFENQQEHQERAIEKAEDGKPGRGND